MDNLAYNEEHLEELLDGKIVLMSPRPSINHNRISGNIYRIFSVYLKGKPCEAFSDGVDVFLTEKDRVIPDAMIVCNKDFIKNNGIYGAPDLIVEVLSPGTAKNDRGYKKELYERTGVKEYWIVNPSDYSIEVNLLKNGAFAIDEVYSIDPSMTEAEQKEAKIEFKTSLYEDLIISLKDVFDRLI